MPQPDTEKYGLAYTFDSAVIPQIRLNVPLDQWNTLLGYYDANNRTKQYVHCDVTYNKAGDITSFADAAIRLRGNTSRRRPEGYSGQKHAAGSTDWHHCHFGINLRKYVKDGEHELHGLRKMNLKWFKDDADYVRELYCYDLFRRYGIWTAPYSTYARLWLKVEGDPRETYYGVYNMIESVDTRYVKARKALFGSDNGNLWKCRFGASLSSVNADFGPDDGSDTEHVYEFKSDDNDYNAAEEQLKDFILKLNGKSDESFYKWIKEVCDVELLLKTYAVNVAVGMWDDYWNNCNNFYIYFNSTDKYSYKFYFIPYDYDNTLGTSLQCGNQSDAGRHDPFHWGVDGNPLIKRVLAFEEFRKIYNDALLELASDDNDYLNATSSIERCKAWQASVCDFVRNDTGEDCEIRDVPASWGNHGEYRVIEDGANNFFRVKIQSIKNYCK